MKPFLYSGFWSFLGFVLTPFSSATAAVLFHEDFDGTIPYIATPATNPKTPGPYSYEVDGKSIGRDSWLDFRNRARGGQVGERQIEEGYAISDTTRRETVLAGIVNHADTQIWATFLKDLFPDFSLVKTVTVRLRTDKNRDGVFNDTLLGNDITVVLYGVRTDNVDQSFFHVVLTAPEVTRDTDGFFTLRYTDVDLTRGGKSISPSAP